MKVIGGFFGIETGVKDDDKSDEKVWFLNNSVSFINGRSALSFLCKVLKPNKVWLPSYTPDFIIDCLDFLELGFYELDKNLKMKNMDWIEGVKSGDVFFYINYFGFPFEIRSKEHIFPVLRELGVHIVEDACQSLMSAFVGADADYTILSLRKFVGVPDGGLLICGDYNRIKLDNRFDEWIKIKTQIQTTRREFDDNKISITEYEKLKRLNDAIEKVIPVNYIEMSDISKFILHSSLNYREIIKRRFSNFTILLEELYDVALIQENNEASVPYSFPIVVENRNRVKEYLFKNNIDTEIHWDLTKIPKNFSESYELSGKILSLPCDQRYNEEDMYQVSETLKMIMKEVKV